jgi:hypothetical protein
VPKEHQWARVTLRDDSRVQLRRARIDRDSVTGNVPGGRTWRRIGISLDEVTRLESRRVDVVRTLLLVGVVVTIGPPLVFAIGCAIASSSGGRCLS